jgi:hypothetical protein
MMSPFNTFPEVFPASFKCKYEKAYIYITKQWVTCGLVKDKGISFRRVKDMGPHSVFAIYMAIHIDL